MIGEYVLGRGFRKPLSLKEICKRRKVSLKSDIIEHYMDNQISFSDIPWTVVEKYGRQDIISTREVFESQMEDLKLPRNKNLLATVKMMNEFLIVLTDMEINGIKIDTKALEDVKMEFRLEFNSLRESIDQTIWERMGDTRINPSSPEQLSWLIYGKKVADKKRWSQLFNIGIDKVTKKSKRRPRFSRSLFSKLVKDNTMSIMKTQSEQCPHCSGRGTYRKYKKDGEPYKNTTKCESCHGEGLIYTDLNEVAGFGQHPRGVSDVAEGGFRTDKFTLNYLLASENNELREFLRDIVRYNSIDTYLNTFVTGIEQHTNRNDYLHPKFMQCVTATGRLSSRDPNFQNQPRGTTFPIRKAVVSRFNNGKIMEMDFSQLEFRTAVFLAQDKQGMEDINNGVDVHQYTADVIGCSRQDAKAHTFKPLYGGVTGTENEKRYYDAFKEKYSDIAKWHERLQSEAIQFKVVKLPSGREYAFPGAQRQAWGGSTYSTQIKNYPVQGFATADIVPLTCIEVYKLMKEKNMKSVLINTVHDSIVVDIFPTEEEDVIDIFTKGANRVIPALKERYNINFNIPLDIEMKIGYDWLNLNEVTL
jgi:DNA polymerase I-like protein with 3'-5' exonuclease and polymerase domains